MSPLTHRNRIVVILKKNLSGSLNLDLLNFPTSLSKIKIISFNTRKSTKLLPYRIFIIEWARMLGQILSLLFCLNMKQPAGYDNYISHNHDGIFIRPTPCPLLLKEILVQVRRETMEQT